MTQDLNNVRGGEDNLPKPGAGPDAGSSEAWKKIMKCDEIQGLLLDYMMHELGQARSALVREHLRKCPDCQAAVTELQSTLDILGKASKAETGVPHHLSHKHRARIVRASIHPWRDWIENHIVVSLLVALLVIVGFMAIAYIYKAPEPPSDNRTSYTVTIGNPRASTESPKTNETQTANP